MGKIYGASDTATSYSTRFMSVIRRASEQTGRGVVVLIDEYDKPLLNSFHDETLQKQFREILTAFYSVLKTADPWLRFVFITGGDEICTNGHLQQPQSAQRH